MNKTMMKYLYQKSYSTLSHYISPLFEFYKRTRIYSSLHKCWWPVTSSPCQNSNICHSRSRGYCLSAEWGSDREPLRTFRYNISVVFGGFNGALNGAPMMPRGLHSWSWQEFLLASFKCCRWRGAALPGIVCSEPRNCIHTVHIFIHSYSSYIHICKSCR